MQISGFFDTGNSEPYVKAHVLDKIHNAHENIYFLVDTGSDETILSLRDLSAMGLKFKDLKKEKESQVSSVGGLADVYYLEKVMFSFKTNKGTILEEKFPKLYVVKHRYRNGEEKQAAFALPSFLGRDFLNKFSLFLNKKKNTVLITNDRVSFTKNK